MFIEGDKRVYSNTRSVFLERHSGPYSRKNGVPETYTSTKETDRTNVGGKSKTSIVEIK